jgi:hypothetical protein
MASWMTDLLGDADAALKVEIAWGADLTAASSTWSWTDITTDVYENPGIQITKARGDEASTSQPAQCSMRLRNETGNYSLGGESPNYPNVRQGTPVRVRVDPDGSGFQTRFFGAAVGFTPRWAAPNAGYVTLTASGTLRRLGQGLAPIQSSMRRDVEGDPTTVAYWPCEEEGRAGAFLAGVGPHFLTWNTPPDLSAETYFECSKPLPVLKGSWWTGLASMAYTGEWLCRFLAKFPEDLAQTGTSGGNVITIFTSGTAAVWRLNWFNGAATGQFELAVYESDLTPIYASGVFTAQINQALMGALISISAVQNGGNIDLAFAQSAIIEDAANTYGFADTIAGQTMGAVTGIWVNQGGDLDQVTIGHVAVHNAAIAFWDGLDAARAWRGESVTDRLTRLQTETGETVDVNGISYVTMGPQLPKTILDLYRECELADGGTLYDGDMAGLSFECRENREGRAADLTLTATSSHVKPGFEPTHDDQRIRNRAVITRVGGGAYSYTDYTGPLGANLVGAYETSATVSLNDDVQQVNYAAWIVHLGTVEGYRHPSITVNLAATPSLAADVLALKPGYRIDIEGLDDALTGYPGSGPLSLVIEGIQEQLTSRSWIVTFACSPWDPWNVAQITQATYAVQTPTAAALASSANSTTSDSVTVALPDHQPGDVLLIYAAVRNNGVGTIVTPTGWKALVTNDNTVLLGCVSLGDTPDPVITASGGGTNETLLARAFVAPGLDRDLSRVVHASATATNTAAANVTVPALTISEDNCLVLVCGWKGDDWTSVAALSGQGFTELFESPSTAGSDAGIVVDYKIETAATSVTATSLTVTGGTNAVGRAMTVALRLDPDPLLFQLDTDDSELAADVAQGATSISVTTNSGPLWTTGSDDFPYDMEIGGVRFTVTACVDATSPQTMTVDAAPVARSAGAVVRLWKPPVLGRPKGL